MIALIIDNLGSGGAQRLLINTAKELSKKHEIKIILHNSRNDFFSRKIKNVLVKKLKVENSNFLFLRKILSLKSELKDTDLVISYLPSSSIYVFLSKLFLKKKYHISCEVSVSNPAESKIRRFILNYTYLFTNHIICNSFTQSNYLKKNIILKNKVSTIWNGISDINFVTRKKREKEKICFIVVARVSYPKNGLRLLKSLKIFYKKYKFLPHIKWIGRKDYSDKFNLKIIKEMESFLDKNPVISEKFKFIGEKKLIEEEYSKADAIILPSVYEGLPFVICEAMMNGCPVIASRITDNDIILGKNGERGLLFDPYCLHDISLKLNSFINLDQEKIDIMTVNARKFAEKHFTVDSMVKSYYEIIDKYQ